MKTTIDLLNKIRWDKNENDADYEVFYYDRVNKQLIGVPFNLIKRVEGSFMVIDRHGEEVQIPTHRIKEIRKLGVVVWKR